MLKRIPESRLLLRSLELYQSRLLSGLGLFRVFRFLDLLDLLDLLGLLYWDYNKSAGIHRPIAYFQISRLTRHWLRGTEMGFDVEWGRTLLITQLVPGRHLVQVLIIDFVILLIRSLFGFSSFYGGSCSTDWCWGRIALWLRGDHPALACSPNGER